MPAQLDARQRHVVRLLAACKPLADVARFSGTCEATIRRWKEIPEFAAELTQASRRRMVAAGRAFDRRLEKVIDATWKAQRELLAYVRGEIEIPFKRLIELRAALAAGERMLNQIRFSTRAKNRAELLLFMRKKGNSELASASLCNEVVNKITEGAETPQNPPISGHAPVAWASCPCSPSAPPIPNDDCMGWKPMPRIGWRSRRPEAGATRPASFVGRTGHPSSFDIRNSSTVIRETPQKSLIFGHAFVALVSSQCSRRWEMAAKTHFIGKMPMPRAARLPARRFSALHPRNNRQHTFQDRRSHAGHWQQLHSSPSARGGLCGAGFQPAKQESVLQNAGPEIHTLEPDPVNTGGGKCGAQQRHPARFTRDTLKPLGDLRSSLQTQVLSADQVVHSSLRRDFP